MYCLSFSFEDLDDVGVVYSDPAEKFLEVDTGDCPIPAMIGKLSSMREDDEESYENEEDKNLDENELSTDTCKGKA